MSSKPTQSEQSSELKTISIASSFPSDGLLAPLEFWMRELGMPLKPELTPFNQVFQQLLDPASLLNQNANGINVVALRAEEIDALEFVAALKAHVERAKVPVILSFCPGKNSDPVIDLPNVVVISSDDFANTFGARDWQLHSPHLEAFSYNEDFFTALGALLARKVHALRGPVFKAIALDCDQTLWRGVCAEEQITIDVPRRALQQFMLEQRNAGMLLCLCSKNQEADVLRVLGSHPDMLLRREHFAGAKVNWEKKSENLRALASDLNIALNSIIYIDDDPVERAEVTNACPELCVLQLPANPGEIPSFLARTWAFDKLASTAEDKLRSDFYNHNARRESLQKDAPTLEDFLARLELRVDIRPLSPPDYARVAQLTQRTTQFNLSGIRRTELELKQAIEAGLEGIVAQVRDRFGDYGDVAAVLFKSDAGELDIDTFVLSCRALGRGVEQHIWRYLGQIAQTRSLSWITARLIPTERNEPAQNFLKGAGAPLHSSEDAFVYRIESEKTFAAKPSQRSNLPPVSQSQRTARINYNRIATDLSDLQKLRAAQEASDAADRANPLEVEKILRTHPHIREARVLGDDRLTAYVVVDRQLAPRIAGRPRFTLPHNLAVVEQARIETEMLYHEMFDQQIYFRHGIELRDGSCVIDAGANIGFFTMFIGLAQPTARIFSFEPVPPVFDLLRINTSLYAPNARIFNCGVSDVAGRQTIEFHPHLSGASSYFGSGVEQKDARANLERKLRGHVDVSAVSDFADQLFPRALTTERFETQMVTLSDIFDREGITRVDLLKIDVEKSEMKALRGVRPEHWPMVEQVVMEVHSAALQEECAKVLQEHGFSVTRDSDPNWERSELSYLYATRLPKRTEPTPRIPLKVPLPPLVTAADLRHFVRKNLSDLKQPLDFLFLDELPPSDSLFPKPTAELADLDRVLRPPENPIQQEVANIWASRLRSQDIGIDQNFFELGGHSLLAAAVLDQVQKAFAVELSLGVMFESPTIERLSEKIEAALIASLDETELANALPNLIG